MISPIKNVFSIATAVALLGKRGPERHTPVSSGNRSLEFSSRGVVQRPVNIFSAICQFWQFPAAVLARTI